MHTVIMFIAYGDIQILLQLPVGYDISPLLRVNFKISTTRLLES